MESPSRDDDMSLSISRAQAQTSIPKTVGILNIIFGSLLLLCVICSSLNLAMQSAFAPMMAANQQQFQEAIKAERQRKLQDLEDLEKAANDEKEKAALRAKQKALKAAPAPKIPDMAKFMQNDTLHVYVIAELVSGLLLNILMIVSGAGLLACKEWARVLAIWAAALKILRLIALYVYFALVVVPDMVKKITTMFQDMFEEMGKAAAPGPKMPGPQELAQVGSFMGASMTVFAIGMIILGVIYPIIVLILLPRPRVKAACAARKATDF